MSTTHRSRCAASAVLALACFSSPSFALNVPYSATQGPKENLLLARPPTLSQAMTTAISGFNGAITLRGGNEFEATSNPTSFSYTGGTASLLSGTPTVINGDALPASELLKGRYNMTPDLTDPNTGAASFGHWLEATSNFTYRFSSAVSAFGFYGTDFGDFSGTFAIDFLNGSSLVYSTALTNPGSNGNLLFFGLAAGSAFDTVVFRINQVGPDIDVLGFDSFFVGTSNNLGTPLPEPGSLALVGLALAGIGATARMARRARRS